jgi:hypothetical protein
MFFKRQKLHVPTFEELIDQLRSSGYEVRQTPQGLMARRGGFGAILRETGEGRPSIAGSGLVFGDEVAELTDLGYQKIFMTPGGRKSPAVAEHLHGLHSFCEDLRESLAMTSLYNEGLGTTNERHLYDRVDNRDLGVPARPWEKR